MMNAELTPNKGVGTAVRALAELAHRHPNLALVVCGEGESRSAITELACSLEVSSRVFLPGFIPNARRYLYAADIYLMPSRKEGLPLALLEAGLASLPVIASKIGGIPEVVTDQETGLFMPRGNTHILAKAVSHYLDHPDEAAKYGKRLYDRVRATFSAEDMVANTTALY
jgi:glycosyltransferase involved in cell wall biosynthesis